MLRFLVVTSLLLAAPAAADNKEAFATDACADLAAMASRSTIATVVGATIDDQTYDRIMPPSQYSDQMKASLGIVHKASKITAPGSSGCVVDDQADAIPRYTMFCSFADAAVTGDEESPYYKAVLSGLAECLNRGAGADDPAFDGSGDGGWEHAYTWSSRRPGRNVTVIADVPRHRWVLGLSL